MVSKTFDFNNIELFDDNKVIEVLTRIKGIGRWTSEMFLIFSLGRLDVISFGDAGLRRAIRWLYDFENNLNNSEIAKISCMHAYRLYD